MGKTCAYKMLCFLRHPIPHYWEEEEQSVACTGNIVGCLLTLAKVQKISSVSENHLCHCHGYILSFKSRNVSL